MKAVTADLQEMDRDHGSRQAGGGPADSGAGSGRADQAGTKPGVSFLERLVTRRWAVAATSMVMVLGMGYLLEWAPTVFHAGHWSTSADVWDVWRAAHYVGWGDVGGVYDPSNGIVAFPGFEVVLAPFAILSGHLSLTESYSPILLTHPTAALVLQPVELISASTVIFATDTLAERIQVPVHRRIGLCFVIGLLALSVAAFWGHAEDALATAFAIYGLLAALDGKWAKCGWLLGFGVAVQPLVLPLLPLLIAASPPGERLRLAVRSCALSAVLVALAFIDEPTEAYRALVRQAAIPALNHVTPWIALTPKIPADFLGQGDTASVVLSHRHLVTSAATAVSQVAVTGGPGRLLYLAGAVILGVYVWRRPQSPVALLWLAAAVLATRCLFEAVICPYYLAPPLFLALVMAARPSARHFEAALFIATATSVYAYFHFGPWVWWLPVVVGLTAVMVLGYPGPVVERVAHEEGRMVGRGVRDSGRAISAPKTAPRTVRHPPDAL